MYELVELTGSFEAEVATVLQVSDDLDALYRRRDQLQRANHEDAPVLRYAVR
jgi:hypothetical protein